MIKIRIISVGKIKEKSLDSLIGEYMKRLSAYSKCEAVELNDAFVCKNPNQADIDGVLLKEAEDIEKNILSGSFIVSMCIEGKKLDSEGFAALIEKTAMSHSAITFIIGSSHGLHERIKKQSNLLLSMSDMTFPHNLAKLMLTEQIYRAFKINSNEKYHK